MAAKESNPLLQHIDKIALAAGVGVLGLVFVLFFTDILGDRFALGDGPRKQSPDQAFQEIESTRDRVRSQQDSDRLPQELAEREIDPNFEEQVLARMVWWPTADPAADEVALLGGPGLSPEVVSPKPPAYPSYAEVRPPLAEDLLVRRYDLVFDASAVPDAATRTEYQQRIGNQLPADFPMVTVAGYFDFNDWADRLREGVGDDWVGEPDQGPPAPAPPGMWEDKQVVVGAYLIRSEWSEDQGAWTAPVRIKTQPAPDQQVFEESFLQDPDAPNAIPVAALAEAEYQRILRLPAPPPTANDGWTPPRLQLAIPPVEGEAFAPIRRDLGRDARATREDRRAESASLREVDPRDGSRRPRRAPLAPGAPGVPGAPGQEDDADPILAALPIGGDGRAAVWAHDLSVEYGKTYRYRLVVNVVNPFYGASGVEADQYARNYTRLALGPDPAALTELEGDWSEPVVVPRRVRFFFTGATNSGARLEVRRVYDGQPRTLEGSVEPGDAIGGLEDGVDFATGAVVVDVITERIPAPSGPQTRERLLYLDDLGRLRSRLASQDQQRLQDAEREAQAARRPDPAPTLAGN
ncbi:MAG: hypothetical protein AAGA57_05445 [Planctomycetota bacterium]